MAESHQLPPAAIVARQRVEDFDTWKRVFDAGEDSRKEYGFIGHHINRAEQDPNSLSVYLAVGNIDQAKAWFASQALASKSADGGVIERHQPMWMTPVRQAIFWDRQLPSMLITHRVQDFDTWLAVYDEAGYMQRAGGIIGHAANRSMDDPSMVVVYHQAETFDTLRSFMQADDLRRVMKEAGVVSDPDVSYHTGGWGKQY